MDLTLNTAQKLAANCLSLAAGMGLKPLTVAVLDSAGNLKVLMRQDGTSTLRPEIAQAIEIAREFGVVAGELQAERRWLGVDAVRAADRRRHFVFDGALFQRRHDAFAAGPPQGEP